MYSHQDKKVHLHQELEIIKRSIVSSSYDDLPKCVLESALLISWLMQQYPRRLSANLASGSLHAICCAISCFLDEFDVSTLLLTPVPDQSIIDDGGDVQLSSTEESVKDETLPQSEDHNLSVQKLLSFGEQPAGADEFFCHSPVLSPIFDAGAEFDVSTPVPDQSIIDDGGDVQLSSTKESVKDETLPQSEDQNLSVQELSSFGGEQPAGADEFFCHSPALSPIFDTGAELAFEPQMTLKSSIEHTISHSPNATYSRTLPLLSWSELSLPPPIPRAKPTYVVDDDEDAPSTNYFFNKFDFYVNGEYLYCCICETNAYEINGHHVTKNGHERRVRLNETPDGESSVWEVVKEGSFGFLCCTLCQQQFEIEIHCSGEMHALSKEFKCSEKLLAKQAKMYLAWESTCGQGVFDDLLTLELAGGETSFCVGCDQSFADVGARRLHQTESVQHKLCVRTLWDSDVFAYAFGISRKGCIRYCTLCKVGLSNAIEHDHHVYSQYSKRHATLLRDFRARVFPDEYSKLFHQPVRDGARYSLDVPLRQRLVESSCDEADSLLQRLILVSVDKCAMCSLCDQYVSERQYTKHHRRTLEHCCLEQQLKESFGQPSSKHFGIVQKRNGTVYCVLCHVGFTNNVELNLHVNSKSPHTENVQIVSSLDALV